VVLVLFWILFIFIFEFNYLYHTFFIYYYYYLLVYIYFSFFMNQNIICIWSMYVVDNIVNIRCWLFKIFLLIKTCFTQVQCTPLTNENQVWTLVSKVGTHCTCHPTILFFKNQRWWSFDLLCWTSKCFMKANFNHLYYLSHILSKC